MLMSLMNLTASRSTLDKFGIKYKYKINNISSSGYGILINIKPLEVLTLVTILFNSFLFHQTCKVLIFSIRNDNV